ncbi:MAG: magnesium transporter [Clostridia bacterium]|nr:magnesium transporter [Clostridia bacterium]
MEERIKELVLSKNFGEIRKFLLEENAVDIANLFETLEGDDIVRVFRLLPKELAAETFSYMEADMQQSIVEAITDRELSGIIDELFLDDTVDFIDEMPANVVKRVLKNTDPNTRKLINHFLQYEDDTAGSIMTIEFVDLKKQMTVREAFEHIRKIGVDKETVYTCYVTNKNRKLQGVLSVKDLLLADYDNIVGDIMDTNVIYVHTDDDKEEVVNALSKYNFLALPVVDKESRLVGIVTIDDAIDVLQDENTEDIEKMAAITPSDKSYFKTGVFETFVQRIPWLMILMISAAFTGAIISYFEEALGKMVILTSFIPMFMGTGGNAGGQSSVTIIRGISLGEIEFGDLFKAMWKEIRVGVLCGISLAFVNFLKLLFIDKVNFEVSMVVNLTLVATVFLAKIIGCVLPITAKKLKLDPAVVASPFITTIIDALSLVIYFNIASNILNI